LDKNKDIEDHILPVIREQERTARHEADEKKKQKAMLKKRISLNPF
jgi:hypothetical protein